jgi:hypothetical protein
MEIADIYAKLVRTDTWPSPYGGRRQWGMGPTNRVWDSIPPQVHANAARLFRILNHYDGDFGFITRRTMIAFMLESGLERNILNNIW